MPAVLHLSRAPIAVLLALAALGGACGPEGETSWVESPTMADVDGDGVFKPDDCDDRDDTVFPDATESPDGEGTFDGKDNDCDGTIDEGTANADDDHDGWSERQGDCLDDNIIVYPGAPDGCDNIDGDCDGLVDESAADAQEPNDFRNTAIVLGKDGSNDLTCDFAAVNLNLLPTSYNAPGPDEDWFTFYVEDGETTGCTYGITATLKDIPAGQTVEMRLYPTGSNTPVAETTLTGSPGANTAVAQWVGPRSGEGAGIYYLQVTSPTPSDWCAGGMRLVVQGLAPPIVEPPEEE